MATVPAGFVDEVVASGLERPTSAAVVPGGRVLIIEEGGTLRVVKHGQLLPTPALTLPVNSVGERGLLGVTTDPKFASNHFIYIYYTTDGPPLHNRVSRFTMKGDAVVPGSEKVLFNLDPLSAAKHNGGAIHVGADGKLYIGVGENGEPSNSQTLGNVLGKVLRINRDGTIPKDNPFYKTATGANRAIWALGLRNPYSLAIQPHTGRVLINDVGQDSFEEVDEGIAGANYGWPTTEGLTTDPRFVSPIYSYTHADGSSAITAGTFYNPPAASFPKGYVGSYFFGDLSGGYIKRLTFPNGRSKPVANAFATGVGSLVDLDVASNGDLYYMEIDPGALHRIRFVGNKAPHGASPTA